jgi:hypothetical protein
MLKQTITPLSLSLEDIFQANLVTWLSELLVKERKMANNVIMLTMAYITLSTAY